MIKSAIALAAAAPLMAAPALAGPYVNVETNAGWTGGDYTGGLLQISTLVTKVPLVNLLPTTSKWVLPSSLLTVLSLTLFLLVRQVLVLL